MRAFLVKYLFGRYWWKLPFQTQYNVTSRGPFWYFNGFLLIAILWMIFQLEWIIQLSIPWSILVLYFGFPLGGLGYFSKHPVKWGELDEEQKWYYGQAALSGELRKKIPFDHRMRSEWYVIAYNMKKRYKLK
jgi:hypothetical protein